jgi:hypothetical protein
VESLQNRIKDLEINSGAGELNIINGITINGTALTPDGSKNVALPIFNGTNSGLVPVVSEEVVVATSFLSAEGSWVDVASLIDTKIDEALTWEEI